MVEDINEMLERLHFSKEESNRVISTKQNNDNLQGYEAWEVGNIIAKEKVNREAMHKVLKSIWFTNDEVCFVALNEEVFLVKFKSIEDRMRIMSMRPWLFNQCLFVMLPFIKVQELDGQMATEVGKAIGDVVAINWRDREGGWMEFIRLKIKIDVSHPLHRIIHLVGKDESESYAHSKGDKGSKEGTRDDNETTKQKRKEKAREWEEDLALFSLIEKRSTKLAQEVSTEGHSGGLVMLWKNDTDVELNLVDLQMDRGWFAWVNNHEGNRMVKERLDRFLMSTDAFNDFPFIATNVLRKANSDDDVIMLDSMRQKPKENTKDPRLSFKFDACWVKDMEAKDIIKRTWNKEDTNIVDKMENVRESLGPWQHNKYRNM
ncbi:hypothetical protein Golax_009111, partial [Gossypium laxum]|nr:hypothetical protein [Gossypium laxum]